MWFGVWMRGFYIKKEKEKKVIYIIFKLAYTVVGCVGLTTQFRQLMGLAQPIIVEGCALECQAKNRGLG